MTGAPHRGMATWWRSSLLVRVVTITTLLGALLTLLLGSVLFRQIADGLVDRRVASVQEDASQLSRQVQSLFDALDRSDAGALNEAAVAAVGGLLPTGEDTARWAVLVPAVDNEDAEVSVRPLATDPARIGSADIPLDLATALAADPGYQQVSTLDTRAGAAGSAEVGPTVVVGSRLDLGRAGAHDLYLFYGMQAETETLDLVTRLLALGGVAVLAILGSTSYLAARLVVDPVRTAARVSAELARGELDVRIPVRGSDELAQLGASFNSMADSLQSTISELQELSRVQQRFVSDVSHELRTPLTTMRMAGELLHAQRTDFGETAARTTELLYQELDRFESLLTDLLEISRFDAGAAVLDAERQDLTPIVRDVMGAHDTLAERLHTPLRLHAPPQPIWVDVDHRRVGRILRNLVGNALEHGEARPVDVTVSVDGQTAQVAVVDHGIGMTQEQVGRVFDRFWRADAARARTTGGTGLGLSIAAEDARLHGGRLEAEGRPGAGATFRLVLPLPTDREDEQDEEDEQDVVAGERPAAATDQATTADVSATAPPDPRPLVEHTRRPGGSP